MAAPMKSVACLIRGTCFLQNAILHDTRFMPRACTHLQITRGRRRTCRPPSWFVRTRTKSHHLNQQELTAENKGFLTEYVEDFYTKKFEETSPLKDGPWERHEWHSHTFRTGVLAVKIGVIPQWDNQGRKFHTTLLQVLDNHVIRYVPPPVFEQSPAFKSHWRNRNGPKYGSVVVGALSCDPQLFTKEYNNLFTEAGVPPKRKLTRFIVTPNAAVQPGTPLFATHFKVGDYVDVQAKTIGHGFQGVVKRWGFKGGPASHGTTKWHRRPGSMGGGREKSGVWKGKKMPGHMGMDWRTLRGLKIWRINTKYNVLYVHGPCIPGPNHCYVRIMDTTLFYRKQAMEDQPPYMPTFFPEDTGDSDLPEEIVDEKLFSFKEPSIRYEEEASTTKKAKR
ncbi:hypothetical protein NP493_446g01040 [Ridgeia piscesae]|uniref:Large ribosomal subunit protein uL3m n=1 Tax=Ridgeia piscesae TaxID=27915 RepID=A0AAD9KZW7_RIDPI|nr:hypothetical protein NP493_446g01040 [Ridgeia piscesae]